MNLIMLGLKSPFLWTLSWRSFFRWLTIAQIWAKNLKGNLTKTEERFEWDWYYLYLKEFVYTCCIFVFRNERPMKWCILRSRSLENKMAARRGKIAKKNHTTNLKSTQINNYTVLHVASYGSRSWSIRLTLLIFLLYESIDFGTMRCWPHLSWEQFLNCSLLWAYIDSSLVLKLLRQQQSFGDRVALTFRYSCIL